MRVISASRAHLRVDLRKMGKIVYMEGNKKLNKLRPDEWPKRTRYGSRHRREGKEASK